MIKTEFESYCQECPELDVKVEFHPVYNGDTEPLKRHAVIKCIHKQRCENIRKHLYCGGSKVL